MARFVHFMPVDSPIFNREFIKQINGMPDIGEHLFLIGGQSTLKSLEGVDCPNVRYEPKQRLDTLRYYDREADIIVLHSLILRSSEIRRLGRKMTNKIVWCIWGHDLYEPRVSRGFFTRIKRQIADRCIGRFRGIVAGFKYDEIQIRQLFGSDVPVYNALYCSGYFREEIDSVVQNHTRADLRLNIMIGHSGYYFLQHKKQIDRLAAYKDQEFVITLVFSYGEEEYMKQVALYAVATFGEDRVHIITDFLTWEEYIDLLCDIDIVIFDFEFQAAFGNLILLSHLGKKLYLSPTGIMDRAFRAEGVTTWNCSEIGKISFETFSQLAKTNSLYPYIEALLDREQIENQWKQLFREFQ